MNSFMSSNRFFTEFSMFSTYEIMSSAKRDNIIFSFSIWMPLITFSCLIALARTSNTMLRKVAKADILVLILILGEKLSVYHH